MSDTSEVVITLREVYEKQQEQGVVQQEINGKLDRLLDKHDRIDERVSDHETRIRLLEKRVWGLPSLAAVLGVASLLLQFIRN